MENPREQQQVVGPPNVHPSNVIPAQYYVTTPVAPRRPGIWTIFVRTLRLLLRRFLYTLIVLGRPLRPIAGFLVVVLALLGVIGWLSYQLWAPKPGESHDTRVSPLPPSSAVETYIQGQRTYNASLMWDALSNEAQANRLSQGASKETLRVRADNEKLQGLQYKNYDYIGGVKLPDGGRMYFYAVDLEFQSKRGKLPMTFTADADGKVISVYSPLNNQ